MRDAGGDRRGMATLRNRSSGSCERKKDGRGPRDRPASRYLLSRIPALQCRCGRRAMAATEDRAMTELVAQDRAPKPNRDKVRMVADDVVTANSLATHLGMTRQNVARLTAEAVIEQRSDGCYDQTASRLKY